jgi:hypothetical protein
MHYLICCCLILGSLALVGCGSSPKTPGRAEVEPQVKPVDVAGLGPRVEAFCGNCHSSPPADSFPKIAWRMEVERGFGFYIESNRDDLDPPPMEAVIAYYEQLAPNELHIAPPKSSSLLSESFDFRRRTSPLPEFESPAVSFISSVQLEQTGVPQLVFCDMRSGELRIVSEDGADLQCELLATCAFPAHVESCDLDGDGRLELVVAELGSARSADHSRGAVIWLRPTESGWKQRLLVSGLGRVADVRPGDFDGDGDTDLLVAEFGHFHTGRILLFENTAVIDGIPSFREHVIDERHGAIHIPVADLNGDGTLDFVALISQEYEVVEAFLNDGQGSFRRELIFAGGDPAFGSSGIQLVDMDADGDLDVLYSNGDTFGSLHLKSYHGIHWLENRGQYPFENRLLAKMVGVQKALAADLDGDGDQDVVAVALLPRNLLVSPEIREHHSVIVLEQTTPGNFIRHEAERGQFYHAGLELTDLDRDGNVDIVVGNMYPDDEPIQPWLTVWSNLGKDAKRE